MTEAQERFLQRNRVLRGFSSRALVAVLVLCFPGVPPPEFLNPPRGVHWYFGVVFFFFFFSFFSGRYSVTSPCGLIRGFEAFVPNQRTKQGRRRDSQALPKWRKDYELIWFTKIQGILLLAANVSA